MTDQLPAYPKALNLSGHDLAKHGTVNHSAEIFVNGEVTTNSIESAFSLCGVRVLHEEKSTPA